MESYEVPVATGRSFWPDWVRGRFAQGGLLPDPWLLVGAGHATQVAMLAARRARGGRAVVLMSPVLPRCLFDLCVIPEHDRPRPAANVFETLGSLNRVQSVEPGRDGSGLLLVGGPSRHCHWDSGQVIDQISRIIRYASQRHWTLATSRRTPAGFAEQVQRVIFTGTRSVRIMPWHETSPGWLQDAFRRADCVWVTEDSVSMLYEALTSGLPTGVLELPPRRAGRVGRGVRGLIRAGEVTPFQAWIAGCPLRRSDRIFDEANRCADWICARWA
jgi:mitochondrial fission protein ELM1